MQKQDEKLQRIRERVRKIRNFYQNLITFFLVNVLLLVVNLLTNPRQLWFYWVTAIWGIVLLFQGFDTFTIKNRLMGDDWEKKKIQELLEKEKDKD